MSQLDARTQVEKIFDELAAPVLGYLATMLGDSHHAEDVLQNVFCRLFRAVTAQQQIQNNRAFVFTIVRNEAIREFDRRRRRQDFMVGDSAIFMTRANATLDPAELAGIEEALLILSAEQREVVYLKIYGELTFQEISDCLNIPANTAASRYRYAMQKLRELLGAGHEQ